MYSAAPSPSSNNLMEILEAITEKDTRKIQFAKEVILFSFTNNNKNPTDIAVYIGRRFSETFNQNWSCSVWEWNKGGICFYPNSRIDIKYNNYKIIIWS